MTHLNEEKMIDLLMEESPSSESMRHLDACADCQDQFQVLREGLHALKRGKPRLPLMPVPYISGAAFRRRTVRSRLIWAAAAAMLLLSLLGFKLEIGKDAIHLELALFKRGDVTEQRIMDLEHQLAEAVEAIGVQSALTQQQLDNRFNTLYQEQSEELRTMAHFIDRKIQSADLEHKKLLVSFDEENQKRFRENGVKGSLQ